MQKQNNVVDIFKAAREEHLEERREDYLSRTIAVCVIVGVILFGAVCFDLGMRVCEMMH